MNTKLVDYNAVRHEIWNGDLLLFKKRKVGFLDGMIAIAGRGVYSHAAKAAWWKNDLFCLEVREFHGGRAVCLSSQVKRHPGRIDVYRPNADNRWPSYDAEASVATMKRYAGDDYGYVNVIGTALTHLPFVRIFVRPDVNDTRCQKNKYPPFCSEAVATAERLGGGVDPIPHLADRFSEPSDLARSPFYKYLFTLDEPVQS